ncbi:hypothetical protein ASF68_16365 [Plantibacter sp. Leaf314]|nr:hypothetical protein ASF68_16365 [Plantibacter sp. Leaf314]
MNLSQMRIMRELAHRGTIAAVARHLHVTAPAISQQLAALHRELGVPLTYRVGREIRLTEAGMALAEMAGTVHTLIDRAAETVREYGDDTGARVRVAAFQSAGQALLPGLLAEGDAGSAPALVFGEHDVAQPEFAELVDQYDLVIAHRMDHDEPWPSEQLSVTTLLSEPFDVAMSVDHPLAARSSVSAAELAEESWIAAHAGFAPDVALGVVEATAGVRFQRAHRVNDYHLAASLIVGGGLLALFPRYTAPRADSQLVLVPLKDVRIARNIDVLARPHALARVAVAGTLERLRGAADVLQRTRPSALVAAGPGLHHVEVWLADVAAERAGWAWLLGRVGFTMASEWSGGESWEAGDTYLTLTASPNLSADSHDRRRPGVNHLAFRAGSREAVDALMAAAPEHGWQPLYQDRYPHAGGEEHYAGWLENEAGFKVEVVADPPCYQASGIS